MQLNLKAPERTKIADYANRDPILKALMTAEFAAMDAWIDANMNNLADAKTIMKRVVKVLAFLLRRELARKDP